MTSILPTKNTRIFAYLLVILLLALPFVTQATHPCLEDDINCSQYHGDEQGVDDSNDVDQNDDTDQADEADINALKALILKLQATLVSLLQQLILLLQSSTPAPSEPDPTPAPSDPTATDPPSDPLFTLLDLPETVTLGINESTTVIRGAFIRLEGIQEVCPPFGERGPCLLHAILYEDNPIYEQQAYNYSLSSGESVRSPWSYRITVEELTSSHATLLLESAPFESDSDSDDNSILNLPTTVVLKIGDDILVETSATAGVGEVRIHVGSIEDVCPPDGFAAPCLPTASISVDNTSSLQAANIYDLTPGALADIEWSLRMTAKAIDTTAGNQSVVLYLEEL